MPNKMLSAIIVAQFVKIGDENSNYTDEVYNIPNDKIWYFFDTYYIVAINQPKSYTIFLLVPFG